MALLTWSDSFSTGVKVMDDQHKGLVKALNDLHAAMLAGQDKAVAGTLLKTLVEYTHDHFAAEEALMTRAKYPKLTTHCEKHRTLTTQVQLFVARYERCEISLNVDLLMFLRDWLLTHIQKEDREYGPWLNHHGLK